MIYYKKKIQQDVGATAIEYGLLSALIAITTIVALQSTGTNLGTTYCTIANKLSQAVGAEATASGCSANSSGSGSSGSSGTSAGSSGSGSGSSGNNSGAGGTTGSPDLDSLTGPEYLSALNSSLKDDFDDDYLDKSLGGNDNPVMGTFINPEIPHDALSLMNDYNEKNPNDQITHVFGMYDASTNTNRGLLELIRGYGCSCQRREPIGSRY